MSTDVQTDRFLSERHQMVATQLRAREISDERVLHAMSKVPRHHFVDAHLWRYAYDDQPLPIGEEQTISQPYIVAITLQALALTPSDVALEVGTGTGYQTALLAELCQQVYSVERHESLARKAVVHLEKLAYHNVTVCVGDGTQGLATYAPFDAIAVSAAAAKVPSALLEQLRDGGRLVMPVGMPEMQELQLLRKQAGQIVTTPLGGCRFVPLVASGN